MSGKESVSLEVESGCVWMAQKPLTFSCRIRGPCNKGAERILGITAAKGALSEALPGPCEGGSKPSAPLPAPLPATPPLRGLGLRSGGEGAEC